MKVAHICLCGPFTEHMAYQENELIAQHAAMGHEVLALATVEAYGNGGQLLSLPPGPTRIANGATLQRLPYRAIGPKFVRQKVRAFKGTRDVLERFQPDVIVFHALNAWELLVVARYVKARPATTLYADCHEDFNNSAKTWASRNLLHRLFYKPIFHRALPQVQKVLCVTLESIAFARDFYGAPSASVELYPLGGNPEDDSTYNSRRGQARRLLGLLEHQLVFLQTGKLDKSKQLKRALEAFTHLDDESLVFLIAGKMTADVEEECRLIVEGDSRIRDLGWQNQQQLDDLLAATDVFVQPFGQTVTTQRAMCSRCAIILQDLPSHRWLNSGNGYLFKDAEGVCAGLRWIVDRRNEVTRMKEKSLEFSRIHLDYRVLAARLLN